MRLRVKAMQDTIESVRTRNADLEINNRTLGEKLMLLKSKCNLDTADIEDLNSLVNSYQIADYLKEIEELK